MQEENSSSLVVCQSSDEPPPARAWEFYQRPPAEPLFGQPGQLRLH